LNAERVVDVGGANVGVGCQQRAIELVLDECLRRNTSKYRCHDALPSWNVGSERRSAEEEDIGERTSGNAVGKGDQPSHGVGHEHDGLAVLAELGEVVFDIVEEGVERRHVGSTSAASAVAVVVVCTRAVSRVGERATDVFIAAAVLGDAVK